MWEMCLVVSVYSRDHWTRGLPRGAKPLHERSFTEPLPDAQDVQLLKCAIAKVGFAAEDWLNQRQVSLVNQVVITVYSLEVNFDGS